MSIIVSVHWGWHMVIILQSSTPSRYLQEKTNLRFQGQWRIELFKLVADKQCLLRAVSILSTLLGSVFIACSFCCFSDTVRVWHYAHMSRFSCGFMFNVASLGWPVITFNKIQTSSFSKIYLNYEVSTWWFLVCPMLLLCFS